MLQHPTQKCCNAMSDTPSPHLSSSFATLNAATFSLPFSPLAVTPPLQRIFEDTNGPTAAGATRSTRLTRKCCNTTSTHIFPACCNIKCCNTFRILRHLFQDPNIQCSLKYSQYVATVLILCN